jgi:2,4-diketo-3-deoxy-L-fuconate hydrolase
VCVAEDEAAIRCGDRAEVADVVAVEMWLDVDGQRQQSGSTSTMIYKVPHLVSYCSRFMSLQPGDVISTGTPPGVGMGQIPQRYLKGGEVVTLGISGLGEQRASVLPAHS